MQHPPSWIMNMLLLPPPPANNKATSKIHFFVINVSKYWTDQKDCNQLCNFNWMFQRPKFQKDCHLCLTPVLLYFAVRQGSGLAETFSHRKVSQITKGCTTTQKLQSGTYATRRVDPCCWHLTVFLSTSSQIMRHQLLYWKNFTLRQKIKPREGRTCKRSAVPVIIAGWTFCMPL